MYTIDQIVLFYQYAVGARIDYMNDVRTAVWADKDELNQHINAIRG